MFSCRGRISGSLKFGLPVVRNSHVPFLDKNDHISRIYPRKWGKISGGRLPGAFAAAYLICHRSGNADLGVEIQRGMHRHQLFTSDHFARRCSQKRGSARLRAQLAPEAEASRKTGFQLLERLPKFLGGDSEFGLKAQEKALALPKPPRGFPRCSPSVALGSRMSHLTRSNCTWVKASWKRGPRTLKEPAHGGCGKDGRRGRHQ